MLKGGRRGRGSYLTYFPTIFAFLAILLSIGYVLSLDTNPRVTTPQDGRATILRDPIVYQKAAQKILSSSLTSRSKITINTLAFNREMQRQFPEIQDIGVTLPLLGRRPVVTIQPATPSILLSSNAGLYVLDNRGRAILTASQATQPIIADLPLITDESGLNIEVGKSILPSQSIEFIQNVLAQLKAKQLKPESLTLPALANELHIRLEGLPYLVKLNTESDARVASGTFFAVKNRLENDGQMPTEYIDVRVEERAYYK